MNRAEERPSKIHIHCSPHPPPSALWPVPRWATSMPRIATARATSTPLIRTLVGLPAAGPGASGTVGGRGWDVRAGRRGRDGRHGCPGREGGPRAGSGWSRHDHEGEADHRAGVVPAVPGTGQE